MNYCKHLSGSQGETSGGFLGFDSQPHSQIEQELRIQTGQKGTSWRSSHFLIDQHKRLVHGHVKAIQQCQDILQPTITQHVLTDRGARCMPELRQVVAAKWITLRLDYHTS